jgi:ABC-type transport system involved in multi-copper enzyme maturation permease subunit
MALRVVAIIVLLWLGLAFVRRMGRPPESRNAPRWILTVVLLSLVLGVPGILLIRFALRSGNAALILVTLLFSLALAIALVKYVARAMAGDRRHPRHPRPPHD